jgi:two-component system, chemotaxis family, sensor kinase CheA
VIKGNATEIVDIGHFLPQAFADWFRRRNGAAERPARTVLLVDDSAFFRDMLTPLIKAAGCNVVAVGSGAAAFEALGSNRRFDLIITDIEMPDMDGFTFAEKLRSMPATAALPIIAITAVVSADAIARGRAIGFYDFVAKFDRTGLIAAIKEQGADIERAA